MISRSPSSCRLAACGIAVLALGGTARATEPPHSAELDAMIVRAAHKHGVPETLVRRIVMRESRYNPHARNHSFWGLMQISYPTARSMGFKGSPEQLLNPLTNLTYAVPYLANAFIIAGKREDAAVRLYASGYYASAKSRGLLGALRTAESTPVAGSGVTEEPASIVTASYQGAAEPREAAPQFQQSAQAQAVVTTSAAIAAKDGGGSVAMTVDKHGTMEPPRKWLRDGGTTIIARGEQGVEKIAAYRADQGDAPTGRSHGRSRKNVTFAAIEAPPPSAQAYAADAAPQASQLAQTPSQAAIMQATAGAPQGPATTEQAAVAEAPEALEDKRHHRRSTRRARREARRAAAAQQAEAAPAEQPAAPQPAAQ